MDIKVFIDAGFSGEKVYVERELLYSIDSLYVWGQQTKLVAFDMTVNLPDGTSIELHSSSNALDGYMHAAIMDFPVIKSVIFDSFVFEGMDKPTNKRIGLYVKGL